MGIETEYGVTVPGRPNVNAMVLSTHVVNAYASECGLTGQRRTRWDYQEESPLRDARGFDVSRAEADPTQLTDDDLGLANVILVNGARLYVDHAHPEYSSPEVSSPRQAVLYDRVGQVVMARAGRLASAVPSVGKVGLYKNNTDNKGASYGTHENYLMSRRTPFPDVVRHLTGFLVSRPVFAGAGRVGIGQDGKHHGYQLSSRADFFEVEVGLETTLKRPIINTRDEPHADPEFHRRLHVIIGDANLSEVATYVKMGATSLVIGMIEAGWLADDLVLASPVTALHTISHDVTLKSTVQLRDGRELTGLQLQREYADQAAKFVDSTFGSDVDDETLDVLTRWHRLLDGLEHDPDDVADQVDWVAKLRLLDGYRRRDKIDWGHARLELIDLQYSDVQPEKGLAARLEERGLLQRLTTDAEVEHALANPPTDTRAYFRGECIRRYGANIAAASWDSVIFDLPGRDPLVRVPTLDPFKGTAGHVKQLLDACPDAESLVAELTAGGQTSRPRRG
ncbi:MAG: proteasome accessory factor PafA2 [Actinobacteria bacterium]|nr:proteasome accessory factor PafA2 [Actinomycetota bacterium]MCB9412525.1 proteasome accessory factor PafA2 [Actinomycetota bacterium]